MGKVKSLKDVIALNSSFKTAINLYLSLNKPKKVLDYIPTKSSVNFMGEYINAVLENKEQATLLVGPYGKGKSHLLLVLLAILSLDRNETNDMVIQKLIDKVALVDEVGEKVAHDIKALWNKNKFLPVLITDTTGDLNQAFLYGLNDALKRVGMNDLIPDTYYSLALERIADWKDNYSETFMLFEKELKKEKVSVENIVFDLKNYSKQALLTFKNIYPRITAGSEFNPMAISEVLPLYKSTSEKLTEEFGYSGIYIVFDEFSKFIESQNGSAVGANMKLLQDICELATDSQNTQVFFTMVAHKSIKEYGKYLSQEIINSFTGIEGRIIEKYFVSSSKNNYELIKNVIIKDEEKLRDIPHYNQMLGEDALDLYYKLPAFKSNFLRNEFDSIVLKGCYPLNPFASYLLLNISEKVAQNERTLFTFISNDEPHSMARFISEHTSDMEWSIGADLIYDYFGTLFKQEVSNEFIHNIWLSAEYALGKCTNEDQKKIIKALAIVLIVNKEDEIPASDKYLRLCVNAVDAPKAIEELVNSRFIYKKGATGNYVFKTKAGTELKSEIKRQREIKGDNVNYARNLIRVTGKYYVLPRKYNTIHMMTRYFVNQYMEVDDFLNITSGKALLEDCEGDGKVITLFSFNNIRQLEIKKHIQDLKESRLVVVCPQKGMKIQKQLKDFEIIGELREDHIFTSDFEILKKELPILEEDLTTELENILSNIYEEQISTKVFRLNGEKVQEYNVGNEEGAVNDCCNAVFTKTPIINNEMVNRSIIGTPQTKKSRLNIIQAILTHQDTEDFWSGSNQEATIYRALFKVTGIIENKPAENVLDILKEMSKFIDSCSDRKTLLTELIITLTSAPYGMRKGLIPIYLAFILSKRREDIIIYFSDKEIQISPDIIVNMCENPDEYAIFVSREDLEKEKYINSLNKLFQVQDNRNLSDNRIKDIFICMQRWFRALPQVSRNMINLVEYIEDEKLRTAMKVLNKTLRRVEFNPFESLFIEFPKAFGKESLEGTFKTIDKCKTCFDDYFDQVQETTRNKIYEIYGKNRKKDLFHILKEWYEDQSKSSKQGLYNGRVTNYMSVIELLDAYNDIEVTKKIAKAVTDVYMENWNTGALEQFEEELLDIKHEIESIKDDSSKGEMTLSFTRKNGEPFEKTYSYADESTGSVLKNIIEDTLDEYDDLSVNDRVSILLEMIEKITK